MNAGRLLGLVATRRWWILGGALLGFVAIGSNIALMAMSAYLISKAVVVTNVAELALAVTAVRVLAISRAAFRYLERYVTHAATFRILTDLRVWFYGSIEPLAPARLADRRSGDLLARIVADIETLEDFYVRVLVPPVVAALTTAFACILLGSFDQAVGLVLLGFLAVTGILVPLLTHRLSRQPAAAFVTRRAELSAMVVDEIQGVADLVALDQAEGHRARVLASGEEVDRIGERLAALRGLSAALAAVLIGLCAVAILAVAIPLVSEGRLDGVYLAVLPLAAIASFEAVQPLSLSIQLLGATEAAAARLFELVDSPPPVADPVAPAPEPARHELEVRDLRFGYDPTAGPVLDGLSLSVPAGRSVAVVGPSGSGKSTLVNLLLRFWDYREGEIRIGGRDLHEYRVEDVRRMLGVVPQKVDLFDGSIRDNLALADQDVTDERIEAACRQAQVHDFIAALPDGYGTRIGENGVRLSGGERRRLAIARVIIKDAPIVVLDEATADLDTLTEARLMASLRPFLAGRTTLLISHRPMVTDQADAIVSLKPVPPTGLLAGASAASVPSASAARPC